MIDLEKIQNDNLLLQQQIQQLKIEYQHESSKRKEIEAALRESEERFRTIVDLSPDAIVILSDTKFTFANSAALGMFRAPSMEAIIGKPILDFMNKYQAKLFRASMERIISGSVVSLLTEFSFIRSGGEEFYAEVTASQLHIHGEVSVQLLIRDITERSRNERQRMELEQQLLHVQKKEIVSTLASGLAHDILNILGIIGTAINRLTFLKTIDQKSLYESADQISKATERGRSLVRQLLTFARKSEMNVDLIQINPVIAEIVSVIQRTFPLNISVEMHLADNLPEIRADGNQIHQALLNLCLNARDAIGDSGTIIISSSLEKRTDNKQSNSVENIFLCVSVADNGCGMTKELMANIFEPFFTTKSEASGSGLGLPMVNGIMMNHQGFIEMDSDVGKGTTFRLFFPI